MIGINRGSKSCRVPEGPAEGVTERERVETTLWFEDTAVTNRLLRVPLTWNCTVGGDKPAVILTVTKFTKILGDARWNVE